jgi:hypothetical protein
MTQADIFRVQLELSYFNKMSMKRSADEGERKVHFLIRQS